MHKSQPITHTPLSNHNHNSNVQDLPHSDKKQQKRNNDEDYHEEEEEDLLEVESD